MKVTFLGTGTSHGVPMIGCACEVCRSDDPRDTRLRPSILIELTPAPGVPSREPFVLLVDSGTDFRAQALRHAIARIDAIYYTHAHADHIFGFDELRRFNHLSKRPLSAYGSEQTMAAVKATFGYAYDPDAPRGGGVPDVRLWHLAGPCSMAGHELVPIPVRHGTTEVHGLRVGPFAYLTDCNVIPDASMALLDGVDVLVLDALRHKPHPTHFSLDEAVAVARRVGARQTYFTHMCHDLGHAATCASLPAGMTLSYDGLVIECR